MSAGAWLGCRERLQAAGRVYDLGSRLRVHPEVHLDVSQQFWPGLEGVQACLCMKAVSYKH